MRMVDADNFLLLFNPFSQSHVFHLLPVTKELLREAGITKITKKCDLRYMIFSHLKKIKDHYSLRT